MNTGTTAHEVFHACGLDDIYPLVDIGGVKTPLPDVAAPHMFSAAADWGGGYYPPGLEQKFIVARLIMSPDIKAANVPLPRACVSRGSVWGYSTFFHSPGISVFETKLLMTGQENTHRNPISQ